MRDDAVNCVNATDFETKQDRHLTWNDDGICNPCKRLQDLFTQRRVIAKQFEEDTLDNPSPTG